MDIGSLRQQFDADLAAASSDADLRGVRDKYLSRKHGQIAAFMKALGAASAEDRPRLGQAANDLKQHVETTIDARLAAAAEAARAREARAGAIDVTLPGRPPLVGRRHPLTI